MHFPVRDAGLWGLGEGRGWDERLGWKGAKALIFVLTYVPAALCFDLCASCIVLSLIPRTHGVDASHDCCCDGAAIDGWH